MAAMKDQVQDILTTQKVLKESPFTVPAGYFESFKAETVKKASIPVASPWRRSIPYMAVAASLAFLLSVGSFIQNSISSKNRITDEDYILFSNSFISTAEYDGEEAYHFAEAEIMDEDIIEYLIYLGVSPEAIELSK